LCWFFEFACFRWHFPRFVACGGAGFAGGGVSRRFCPVVVAVVGGWVLVALQIRRGVVVSLGLVAHFFFLKKPLFLLYF
jgi:hypothetical protein